eukprot:194754-Chlamydomonas_euryale.AAC.5
MWQPGSPPTALADANGSGAGPPADSTLRSQHACLQWLAAVGVSVSDGTALVAGGFDAALAHADEWMATRGELGEWVPCTSSLVGGCHARRAR